MKIHRGDIFYCDLTPAVGSEQDGIRPVIIVQNNVGNCHSATVIVVPLTTRCKKRLPTHVEIRSVDKISKESIALLEQIRTVDKSRLREYVDKISQDELYQIEKSMNISLGLV